MLLSCTVAFIISFIYRKNTKSLKFFFLYPASSILQTLFIYATYHPQIFRFTKEITFYSTEIFDLIEIASLYYIYTNLIQSKKAITILFIFYSICYTYFLLRHLNDLDPNYFFIIQNLFIIAGAGYSLSIIYNKILAEKIEKNPLFLITFGALTMATCSLPIYIATDFVFINGSIDSTSVYTINFISYILLNIFIIIAFLCTKNQNSSKV